MKSDLLKLKIVQFEAMPGRVEEIQNEAVISDLSYEQKYLYKMCLSVQNGELIEAQLETAQPGVLDNARWLTRANRILRLYVSTESPMPQLKRLVHNIVNFYASSWFTIKRRFHFWQGAQNYLDIIKSFRLLPVGDQEIQKRALVRNSFFAHPENILVGALYSLDLENRKFAVRKILEKRANEEGSLRVFRTPSCINFTANSLRELLPEAEWSQLPFTSPPILSDLTNAQIQGILEGQDPPLLHCEAPCHSQSVERAVKLMAEATGRYSEHQNQR